MAECKNCVHFEVCCYASHQLPVCDSYLELVRCKDCRRRYDADECPMCFLIDGEHYEYTNGNGFCDRGERRDTDA